MTHNVPSFCPGKKLSGEFVCPRFHVSGDSCIECCREHVDEEVKSGGDVDE